MQETFCKIKENFFSKFSETLHSR